MRRVSESESKARRAVQQATVAAPLPSEGTPTLPKHVFPDARTGMLLGMPKCVRCGVEYGGLAARKPCTSPGVERDDLDTALLRKLVPIMQAFARQNPGDPRADDAHAAFYALPRIADRLTASLPPVPQRGAPIETATDLGRTAKAFASLTNQQQEPEPKGEGERAPCDCLAQTAHFDPRAGIVTCLRCGRERAFTMPVRS